MNKFNRGKFIGVVAASLSAVSLMGVGFATWVIGYQNKETSGDVTIDVDEIHYKSLKIGVEFTKGIKLGETGSKTTYDSFNFDGTNPGDLTAVANITFTLGKDFTAQDFDFTTINLSIVHSGTGKDQAGKDQDGKDYTDNNVLDTNVKLDKRTKKDGLTYFESTKSISISSTELDFDTAAVSGKNKTIVVENKKVEFTWGSMFDGKSPVAFYNGMFNTLIDDKDKETFMEQASEEMSLMKSQYATGAKIKLKLNLA